MRISRYQAVYTYFTRYIELLRYRNKFRESKYFFATVSIFFLRKDMIQGNS
jgi:hypothetical protein